MKNSFSCAIASGFVFLAVWVYSCHPAVAEDPGRAPTGTVTDPKGLLVESDGLEFRFSYFPSLDRLRVLVLHPAAKFATWEVALSAQGRSEVLAQRAGKLPMAAAGETIPLPALADGTYEVKLTLIAQDGSRRELQRTFQRKHFPWEKNHLGQDRVVIPPFTPLVASVDPASVSCVLRRHDMDGTGLWKQVVSQGHELLAAPMRLEIESQGKTYIAAGNRLALAEKAADRVQGGGTWTAGPIAGRTEFAFDYDGMMKVTFQLGTAGQRLDAMQLVIPLKTDEAWLMHAVTDLLRFHYAGRIPDGKGLLWDYGGATHERRYTQTGRPDANGKVWDSGHVGRWQLPGPFVPYIWLGGPERGIAWFAENDRDWSLAADRPTLEIRRQGAVTTLVVHMVTRGVTLARPRTITFGLMATPAKPMPASPVSYRRWWTGPPNEKVKNSVGCGLMGACYYWGSAGPCYAFHPAFANYGIYDEFARLRKGGAIDPAFLDKWLAQFTAPEYAANLSTYRAHVNWSLNFFSGGKWSPPPSAGRVGYVMPYTNGRAINWGEEVHTFLDEWSNIDIADPRWPAEERFLRSKDGTYRLAAYGKVSAPDETGGIAYAVDPVPSWQDLVLYEHKRMLETFADGIYFDNYFLVPNYNPLGPGYIDDEGRLRAGVNIFGFHDLTKRVAVMQQQMGRRPMVFLHMTNANIVPMLSFGTLLLDHEWRDQGDFHDKDFQERLALDDDASLLLAESTGLQSGCLGIVHNLFHNDARLMRNALGVALDARNADGCGRRPAQPADRRTDVQFRLRAP